MLAADAPAAAFAAAAVVQAASAVATVVVTVALVLITKSYARESKRMADVMARDFELRVAPLLEFELGSNLSTSQWKAVDVPLTVRNIGNYPVVILKAAIEFRAAQCPDSYLSEPLPSAQGPVEPGQPRTFGISIPVDRIPAEHQTGKSVRGNLVFRIPYTVRSITGAEVPGCSAELRA